MQRVKSMQTFKMKAVILGILFSSIAASKESISTSTPPVTESNGWISETWNSTNGSSRSAIETTIPNLVLYGNKHNATNPAEETPSTATPIVPVTENREWIFEKSNSTNEDTPRLEEETTTRKEALDRNKYDATSLAEKTPLITPVTESNGWMPENWNSTNESMPSFTETTISKERVLDRKKYNATNLAGDNITPELGNSTEDKINVTTSKSTLFFQNHSETFKATKTILQTTPISLKDIPFSSPNGSDNDFANRIPFSNISDISNTSLFSDISDVSNTSLFSDISDVSNTSLFSDISDVSNTSLFSDISDVSNTSLFSDISNLSNTDNRTKLKLEDEYFNSSDNPGKSSTTESSEYYKTYTNVSLTTLETNDTASNDLEKLEFETSKPDGEMSEETTRDTSEYTNSSAKNQRNLKDSDMNSIENNETKPGVSVEGAMINCYMISGAISLSVPLISIMCFVLFRRKQRHSIDISEIPHVNLKLDDYTLTPIPRISTTCKSKSDDPILSRLDLLEKGDKPNSHGKQAFRNSRLFNGSDCELGANDRTPRLEQPYMDKGMGHCNHAYIN